MQTLRLIVSIVDGADLQRSVLLLLSHWLVGGEGNSDGLSGNAHEGVVGVDTSNLRF